MTERTRGEGRLLVVDAYNLLYRAFHALPPLTAPDGRPANALYGFARMVLALLEELKPTHIAIAVDLPSAEPSYRQELYPAYKANRPPMPEDLAIQLPLLPEVARALSLPIVGAPGFEADDVMGTLARQAAEAGMRVYLATGDQDAYQLVSDHVLISSANRSLSGSTVMGPSEVREKLGVDPNQIVDYKSLAGDSSDNIKGVPGIGPKKAAALLEQFGTVDAALERAEEIASAKLREMLTASADECRTARQVVTIRTDVELEPGLEDLARRPVDPDLVREVLGGLGFRSLVEKLAPAEAPKAEALVLGPEASDADQEVVDAIRRAGRVAVLPRLAGKRLLDLGLAWASDESAVFVLDQVDGGSLFDQFSDPELALPEPVAQLLGDASVAKVCLDAKELIRTLEPIGVTVAGVEEDAGLAAYLAAHGEAVSDLSRLVGRFLGEALPAIDRPQATAYAAARLYAVMEPIRASLAEQGLEPLYRRLEFPVAFVLGRMESRGIRVDRARLRELGGRLREKIGEAERTVHELAGETFTLGSPQQLQVVLFEKLGLPQGRKTKTGRSTDAATLELLRDKHPIIEPLLEWRQLTKLLSTYVDALLELADPETDRVHTQYNQRSVVTGRLSSSDPNLQNIPIRSEWGREVRKCFVAPGEGWSLLACDYSQIELRILAHFSKDPNLLEAFRAGLDVHAHTASQLYEVPIEQVTRDQRAAAKTVNFGIIYGMGPQRLAADMGISHEDAKRFIEHYFATYEGVRRYLDSAKEQAHADGYVVTALGRRRNLPDIHSQRGQVRSAAERAAVNAPIQGTAADLMKAAMIAVDARLGDDPDARLLLQVHDELVLEVRTERVAEAAAMVKALMADPGGDIPWPQALEAPLVVDAKAGPNWGEMEVLA